MSRDRCLRNRSEEEREPRKEGRGRERAKKSRLESAAVFVFGNLGF
jgi:hypothetical protein